MAENFGHGSRRLTLASAVPAEARRQKPRQPRRKRSRGETSLLRDSSLPRSTRWSKSCRKRLFPPTATPVARKRPRLRITSSRSCAKTTDDNQKSTWREGLRLIDLMSQHYNGKSFVDSSSEERIAVLTVLSDNDQMTELPEVRFFRDLKHLTVRGYYTSKIGIHDELEYKGNRHAGGICRLRRS